MGIFNKFIYWLFIGDINGSVSTEFASFFIAVAIITVILYGLIRLQDRKKVDNNESLLLIITAIIAIAIAAIFKVIFSNQYKVYYYEIVLTILSGLVGGTFVILSLNHQNKISEKELKRVEEKNKEDEIKNIRPYLFLKWKGLGGAQERKIKAGSGDKNHTISFELINVGNGRAFDITCNDISGKNIFDENLILNIDSSQISKKIGFDYKINEPRIINLKIEFKDVLDNKYYQEFTIKVILLNNGNQDVNITKTQPKKYKNS